MLASALLAGAIALAPTTAFAADEGSFGRGAGLGLGSAFASLLYAPVKLTYAIGGVLVGGLAWAFSGGDTEVARVVLTPSLLGDYVITPAQLVGDEPIEFLGRDPGYIPEEIDVASSPPESEEAW